MASTRGRLALIAVLVLASAMSIAGAAVYEALSITGNAEVNDSLVGEAGTLENAIEDRNGQLTVQGNQLPSETDAGIAISGAVVTSLGVVLQTPRQPLTSPSLIGVVAQVERTKQPVWSTASDVKGVPRRIYAEPLPGADGLGAVLVVSRSIEELQSQLSRLLVLLVLVGLVVIGLGGAGSYWLAGRVLRPVHKIAATARSLSEQDLHLRVNATVPNDELGDLVRTFNDMLERMESSFNGLKQVTADASHELRAPLALMRAEVDLALSRTRPQAEYVRVLRSVNAEVEHMCALTERLLILARADAGALHPIEEEVDVADFLHEVGARWITKASTRDVAIEVDGPRSGTMVADPALLRRLVDNLLDNAIRHSPTGGRVFLRAVDERSAWVIEVRDEGPGIPPQWRERIFARFSRTDDARTRAGGAAGLGLALSAAIAKVHGGTLSLALDNGSSGAVFILRLPNQRTARTHADVPTASNQGQPRHLGRIAALGAAMRRLSP